MNTTMTLPDAIAKAWAADAAWQTEIDRVLPGVRNARYLPIGKGEPGSELRRLHDAKTAASEAEHALWTRA